MKSFIKYMFATSLGVVFGSLLSLGILTGLVFSLISLSTMTFDKEIDATNLKKDQILEVKLNYSMEEYGAHNYLGMIDPSLSKLFEGKVGLYNINLALKNAAIDKKIKGIYLNLSQVDAGWASLKSIRTSLENFKKTKKPIYAYSSSYNEKSYYLASLADKIFLHKTGDFELNGFSLSPLFLKGLLDKLELKPEIFRMGKFKAAIEPLITDKMSEENHLQNKILLEDLWKEFSSAIAAARNLSAEKLNLIVNNLELKNINKVKELGFIDDFKRESLVQEELLSVTKLKIDPKKDLPFITLRTYMSKFSFKDLLEKTKEEAKKLENKNIKKDEKEVKNSKLALIFMNGEIVSGSGSDKGSVSDEEVVEALRQVKRDERIAGVILRINSPGGSALASDVIWAEIEELKKVKPIYSSFGDVAASGGYYVAAGTNKIFSEANTITGSIGVFGIIFNTKEFFNNKLGITFDNVKTHQYSDLGESNKIMTTEERSIIQDSVAKVYEEFTTVVSNGRNISLDKVKELAEGRVWSGIRAKEIGLVDQIGNLNDAIAALAIELKIDANEIEIFPKDKVVSSFMKSLFAKIQMNLQLELPFFKIPLEQIKEASINKNGVYTRLPYDLDIH